MIPNPKVKDWKLKKVQFNIFSAFKRNLERQYGELRKKKRLEIDRLEEEEEMEERIKAQFKVSKANEAKQASEQERLRVLKVLSKNILSPNNLSPKKKQSAVQSGESSLDREREQAEIQREVQNHIRKR